MLEPYFGCQTFNDPTVFLHIEVKICRIDCIAASNLLALQILHIIRVSTDALTEAWRPY